MKRSRSSSGKKTFLLGLFSDRRAYLYFLIVGVVGLYGAVRIGTYADADADLSLVRNNFGQIFQVNTWLSNLPGLTKEISCTYGYSVTFLMFAPIWLVGKLFDHNFHLLEPKAVQARNIAAWIVAMIGVYAFYSWARNSVSSKKVNFVFLIPVAFPIWFGNALMNPKDIPIATGFFALILLISYFFDGIGKKHSKFFFSRKKIYFWTFVSLVFTIGDRPVTAFIIVPTYFFIFAKLKITKSPHLRPILRASIASMIYLIVTNYYLMTQPIYWFSNLLRTGKNFPWTGAVLSWGNIYRSPHIPRSYLLEMLLAQVPLLIMTVLAVGGYFLLSKPKERILGLPTSIKYSLVVLLGTIVQTFVLSPVIYDNARQVLFVWVFIAVISLYLYDQFTLAHPKNLISQYLMVGLLAISLIDFASGFPYNYIYRNEIARQLPVGSFETDYWGISGKELTKFVEKDSMVTSNPSATFAYIFPQSFQEYVANTKLKSVSTGDRSAKYYSQIWRPALLPDYSAQCPIRYEVARTFIFGKHEILGYVRKC